MDILTDEQKQIEEKMQEQAKQETAREIITLWEDYLYTPTLDFNMNHPEYADMRDDEIVDKLKAKYGVKN